MTKLESAYRPGTIEFHPSEIFDAEFLTTVRDLKKKGHAVVADVTFDSDHKPCSMRIFHYLSCGLCEVEKAS
jgi:hypothetical protein